MTEDREPGSTPRVAYSIGVRFAGGGIGNIAYQAVRGIHQQATLVRLLASSSRPTEIPAELIRDMGLPGRILRRLAFHDPTRWLNPLSNVIYDAWASRQLVACDIFHGWDGQALRSLRRAKELGAVTLVERPVSHPLTQTRLLQDEFSRWGQSALLPRTDVPRALAELEEADYITIPSDWVRQGCLEHGVPEQKLIQIPYGADIERFRPVAKPPGPFRVVFAGQVGLRKGVPYLLDAWRRLGWRDAELVIAGIVTAEMKPVLRRFGTLDGVRFTGYLPDPVAFFQSADVFAFPSIEEGSALVTYEALACGLPVVTTTHAGSAVTDGKEGFLVPIRDGAALAERLRELREDAGLRSRMGVAARARAEQFPWSKYGPALVDAYRKVLAR